MKYNVAMDSVIYTVGYNFNPFFKAYICLHFGILAPLKVS